MTAADTARAVALARANINAKRQLRARTAAVVAARWDALTSWRGPDVDAFAAAVVPVVAGGQRQMAAVTDAYLAQLLTVAGAHPGRQVDPGDFTGTNVRRGVKPLDEWRRPGIEVWSALADGVNLPAAVARGRARAQSLVATDLQLASTNAAQARLSTSSHVTGYQRVPTGDHNCALCLVASTQRYHSGELMAIHPGCSCTCVPIIGSEDPGRVINADLLENTRATIRAQYGPDVNVNDPAVLRQHIVVHDHGELGPVLAIRGQHFAGPSAIPSMAA